MSKYLFARLLHLTLSGTALANLSVYSPAYADEPFSAFGIQLGAEVHGLKIVGEEEAFFDGNPIALTVVPRVENDIFSQYQVGFTPETNLVYKISATSEILPYDLCAKLKSSVEGALINKYPELHEVYYDGATHSVGQMDLFLNCYGANGRARLQLVYNLPELERQAEKEYLNQASKDVSSEGL